MPRGGQRPGAGRKPRARENEIRAALHAAIPPEDVHAKLAEAIRNKEAWAITLYMAYDWGKPRERVELGGADGGPIALTFEHAGAVADLTSAEDGSTEDPEA